MYEIRLRESMRMLGIESKTGHAEASIFGRYLWTSTSKCERCSSALRFFVDFGPESLIRSLPEPIIVQRAHLIGRHNDGRSGFAHDMMVRYAHAIHLL